MLGLAIFRRRIAPPALPPASGRTREPPLAQCAREEQARSVLGRNLADGVFALLPVIEKITGQRDSLRMAKSAAATRAKKPDRRSLCEQLLALRLKHADVYAQMDSLKAELIELATEAGDGFREIFVDQGQVTVAGGIPWAHAGGRSQDLRRVIGSEASEADRRRHCENRSAPGAEIFTGALT
jgi:hypothetical protein